MSELATEGRMWWLPAALQERPCELPRGAPVSERVVEKPEGERWQRRGHVNVDQAWMVDELRLWIGT